MEHFINNLLAKNYMGQFSWKGC